MAASAVVRSNGNGRAGGAGVVRSPVAARETPMGRSTHRAGQKLEISTKARDLIGYDKR
jgi:hypothetical protein